MVRRSGLFSLTLVAMLLVVTMNSRSQSVMTRHVREVVRNGKAKSVGRLPATQIMQLNLVLPLSDQAGLDSFLGQLCDPTSPNYRHFLTVREFTERFGPTQAQYDAVIHFAKSKHFKVVGGSRDGMDVQIKARVSAIEKAFHYLPAPNREPDVLCAGPRTHHRPAVPALAHFRIGQLFHSACLVRQEERLRKGP